MAPDPEGERDHTLCLGLRMAQPALVGVNLTRIRKLGRHSRDAVRISPLTSRTIRSMLIYRPPGETIEKGVIACTCPRCRRRPLWDQPNSSIIDRAVTQSLTACPAAAGAFHGEACCVFSVGGTSSLLHRCRSLGRNRCDQASAVSTHKIVAARPRHVHRIRGGSTE